MKIIAHRGASLEYPENSLAAFVQAARLGADVVECDVRISADGVPVLLHDPDLQRLTGKPGQVDELSLAGLRAELTAAGHELVTLAELLAEPELVSILLHLKVSPLPDHLLSQMANDKDRIICGVQSLLDLQAVRDYFPPERILAFLPRPADIADFIKQGAGIIRLWENWLEEITPEDIKKMADVQVWIMSRKNSSMDGCPDSLASFLSLKADGVLLNDVKMALNWRRGGQG